MEGDKTNYTLRKKAPRRYERRLKEIKVSIYALMLLQFYIKSCYYMVFDLI